MSHIRNRSQILDALRRELVGPDPRGQELDCTKSIIFAKVEDSYGPWKQWGLGEEILQRDRPTRRYGIGVLYPFQTSIDDNIEDAGLAGVGLQSSIDQEDETGLSQLETLTSEGSENIEDALSRIENLKGEDAPVDLDLSSSNAYRPSSMGISFLASFPSNSRLVVSVNGGHYVPIDVKVAEKERTWWLRKPVSFEVEFADSIFTSKRHSKAHHHEMGISSEIVLSVEVYSRPNPFSENPSERLLTVVLVNRSSGNTESSSLFQSYFEIRVDSPGSPNILPYPDSPLVSEDLEERSLALLYRDYATYAVGHGCAANWKKNPKTNCVSTVSAESLPSYETPSTTPDITDKNNNPIQVSMLSLAGLGKDNGFDQLERVVALYKEWILEQRSSIETLIELHKETAERHLANCEHCVSRIEEGLEYLTSNPMALTAFQLANRAILLQQLTSRREPKIATYNTKNNRWDFDEPYNEPDFYDLPEGRGNWRAFQIAFLLMSLKSTAEDSEPDRETVELIWFPTGGGKTEAYLGLTAFSLFMRRLRNPDDTGVHVLMRYTLRLLTAQQFQRASGLICAMEVIRRQYPNQLGEKPFSIGIWVGGSNTPNTKKQAIDNLSQLQRGDRYAENKFVLSRCPWCGSQLGPMQHKRGTPKSTPKVLGYYRLKNTIGFRCEDRECPFSEGIPVYVIDEDIYENCPSLVIGTVDKFAMLTWRPEARSLFGIDQNGRRAYSPPGLIIQDELHLISGPLGSMVGLYEAVIEELCTDRRNGNLIRPKIVSSTATIRRYEDQIRALYGRENVVLFPPSGLDAGDSFFARYARDQETGGLLPGKMYVGVHAPGLGSLQTVQVRTFTALVQAPLGIEDRQYQDPWWTLLLFFNSLRELGTTLSLFQSDIPDYLKVVSQRFGIGFRKLRQLRRVFELTGRLRSDEVPQAIANLEISRTSKGKNITTDVCLASNILEVGVDIDRLSLMAVVGQPKSTSQYIQVTGRVGRRWWERPGLIATIYTASKPRDRSHFEKFRTYHEKLYAQVEPVSVTPFSPPALDRALHAVMVLYARQLGDKNIASSPHPYPEDMISDLKEILLPRVRMVDPAEQDNFEAVFNKRVKQWKRWQRTYWKKSSASPSFLLLHAGEYAEPEQKLYSWSTPTSMRNVDAECQAVISSLYITEE